MFKLIRRQSRLNWALAVGIVTAMSFVGLFLIVGDESIHACSCGSIPPSEALPHATVVFAGEVVANRWVNSGWAGFGHHYEIEFQVDVVWKGPRHETMFIYTLPDSGGCGGYPFFKEGQEYVVYAYGDTDAARVGLCSRINLVTQAHEDFDFLGDGTAPVPGTAAPTATPAPTTTPIPTPSSTPTATPTPTSSSITAAKPTPQSQTEAEGGGCNVFAQSTDGVVDAWRLTLIAGIAWFGFRNRRPR